MVLISISMQLKPQWFHLSRYFLKIAAKKLRQMPIRSAFFFFFLPSLFFGTAFPGFLARITKDFATKMCMLTIYLKTPPQPTNLLLHLGASFTLVDCIHNYTSSAHHSIPCGSSLCSSFGSRSCTAYCSGPGCSNDSCTLFLRNPMTRKPSLTGQAAVDSLSMPVTDGRNPGRLGLIPGFVFSCSERSLLKGVTKGAAGLAGLGRSNLSIPAQVSNFSSENSVFALCLSGSPSAPGVAFFGSNGPYYFLPEIDLSKHLNYTPLLVNPVGSSGTNYSTPSADYFIGLTCIKVNGRAVDFNQTLLTKLSTVTPYTMLHTTIFKVLTEAFVNESTALNLTVREPVSPFNICYNADDITSTRLGPAVPTIDLVLHEDDVFWRIFGSNSMLRIVRDGVDVWCLGFLDGGANPRSSVVIGGHQMEDNLLQFDVGSKKLGFTSSIQTYNTMCANFNFTTSNNLTYR